MSKMLHCTLGVSQIDRHGQLAFLLSTFPVRSGGYHTYFVTTSRTQLRRGKGAEIVKSLHSFLLLVAFNHETGENKH